MTGPRPGRPGAIPPSGRRAAGNAAEAEVATWLEAQGWRILDRNFTIRGGELDLVAQREGVRAFIEVRSRTSDDAGAPEETIGARKIRRVVLAARHWLARHGDGGCDLRFDVVAVRGHGPERTFEHFPGAFEAGQ